MEDRKPVAPNPECPDRERLRRLLTAAGVKFPKGRWPDRDLEAHSRELGCRVPRSTWPRLVAPCVPGDLPHRWEPAVLAAVARTLQSLGATVNGVLITLADIEDAHLQDYGYTAYATLRVSANSTELARHVVGGLPGQADQLAIVSHMLRVVAEREGSDEVLTLLAGALDLLVSRQ